MEFGGTPLDAVIRAIAQDRFAVCDQIEEEVVRVMTHKFGWEAARVRADLALYWLEALRVELEGTITGICRDPKDEPEGWCRVCHCEGERERLDTRSQYPTAFT